MKSLLLLVFTSLCFLSYQAQGEKNLIREGNKSYTEGNYAEAQEKYRQSLNLNAENKVANFNLADALYRQEKYSEAAAKFSQIAKTSTDKAEQAKAYHNLGNALYSAEEYGKSAQAYKSALRLNSNDNNTRYNLMRALEKLQQQKQKKDNKDKQDKDDQEKKDEEKEDEKKEDEKDKEGDKDEEKKEDEGDENKKNEPKPEDGQQQKQEQPNQLSPQAAERMLDALNQEEKKIQAKLKKKKENGRARVIEKDW